MVVVPILAALGLTVPKTSSRAITSPAGTADTMATLAEVALAPARLAEVVRHAGGCIAWGGALDLAPADDILITVERPMELDTEAQMVASILAKKKTVGATHVLIDIPGRPHRQGAHAGTPRSACAALFRAVARGDRPAPRRHRSPRRAARSAAASVRASRRSTCSPCCAARPDAPADLREKSLYLAARLLEMTGAVPPAGGYRAAQQALDSGAAAAAPSSASSRRRARARCRRRRRSSALVAAPADGRIREIDCWQIARVAKCAGAPANAAAGVRLLRTVGDIVARGEPLFEIHAQSEAQLEFARQPTPRRSRGPGAVRILKDVVVVSANHPPA